MLRYVLWRLLDAYQLIIVVWAIMSWIPMGNSTIESIRSVLDSLVEPYVNIFRRFIPPTGGIDFSPVVALLALSLLQRIL